MQYPLLFLYAEDGCRLNIPYRSVEGADISKEEMVTMHEYYTYILQYREGDGNTLLFGGRLLQLLIVDAYCCIEEDILN